MRDNFDNRGNIADRSNRWENRRDRWQNGWQNRHYHHHNWHHGHWHGNYWRPGSWGSYWWNNYPVMTAFGLTTWAVNRVGWAFGYYPYSNPYYGGGTTVVDNSTYDYSQPIIMMPGEETLAGDPADTTPPEVSEESLDDFDKARQEFYSGAYDAALNAVNDAIKEMPTDAVLHEFRALTLFALGKYQDSAATLYPVLSVGPGWDWTTMIGLYPGVDEYTGQLRALESYRNENPDDSAAHFVLSYQYLTAGHSDAAKAELEQVLRINPQDQLSAQLLVNLDPDAELPEPPKITEPPKPSSTIEESQLYGSWEADRDDSTFGMELKENGDFAWTYSQNGQSQEVTGVWEVDDDGVIAMEMNDEGTMLAQLDLKSDGKLDFYMLGDTQGTPPLHFQQQ